MRYEVTAHRAHPRTSSRRKHAAVRAKTSCQLAARPRPAWDRALLGAAAEAESRLNA